MIQIRGHHYNPELDEARLKTQMHWVYQAISRQLWFWRPRMTVNEIRAAIDGAYHYSVPEASISAQLRNLRKPKNGGFSIVGRYRKDTRIFEYQLRPRPENGQEEMFE